MTNKSWFRLALVAMTLFLLLGGALAVHAQDSDGDSIPDADDKCPLVASNGSGFTFGEIYYGCPDRDGDLVPDSNDACPDLAGDSSSGSGCPADTDGDGIDDIFDACPTDAANGSGFAQGSREYGCPDRDGDLLGDFNDRCPDIAGFGSDGCPDRDGDGFSDGVDACPDQFANYGTGCPGAAGGVSDRDGDGFADAQDSCPDQWGNDANGCPSNLSDSDGDGFPDDQDFCPFSNAGGATYSPGSGWTGCPDSDGDQIADISDACPFVWGLESNGCPSTNSGPDSDGDSIPDSNDACPFQAGINYFDPNLSLGCPNENECTIQFTGSVTYKTPSYNGGIKNSSATPGIYAATATNNDRTWWLLNGTDWVQGTAQTAACNNLVSVSGASGRSVRSNPAGTCDANDSRYLPTRLSVGQQARSELNGFSQALRSEPDVASTLLIQIPPGGVFDVISGPRCGQNPKDGEYLRWWEVRYLGWTGWTGESDSDSYWAEPYNASSSQVIQSLNTPAPAVATTSQLPQSRVPISAANATQLQEVGRLEYTSTPYNLALSRTGGLAIGGTGFVEFYDLGLGRLSSDGAFALQAGQSFETMSPDASTYITSDFIDSIASLEALSVLESSFVNVWTGLGFIRDAHYIPNGGSLIVLSTPDQSIDASAISILGTQAPGNDITLNYPGYVHGMAISPDGGTVALIARNNNQTGLNLVLLDLATRQLTRSVTITPSNAPIGGILDMPIAYNADGSLIAISGFNGGLVQIWEVSSLSQRSQITAIPEGEIRALAWSPINNTLAAGGGLFGGNVANNTFVVIINGDDSSVVSSLVGHVGIIESIVFSEDGGVLVSSANDPSVRFWMVQ